MTNSDWINLGLLIVAVISALVAGGSLWFTFKQWKKIEKKIGMINESGKAAEILPAWYTKRMMPIIFGGGLAREYWPFGLLTSDGRTLVVTGIISLSDDGKWMDVDLATRDAFSIDVQPNYVFAVAEDRTKSSVQVSCVVAAMELATS